jgi:hypothetical protein
MIPRQVVGLGDESLPLWRVECQSVRSNFKAPLHNRRCPGRRASFARTLIGRISQKCLSRSTGRPKPLRTQAISSPDTLRDSGKPSPRSQRPKAMLGSSGSISVNNHSDTKAFHLEAACSRIRARYEREFQAPDPPPRGCQTQSEPCSEFIPWV